MAKLLCSTLLLVLLGLQAAGQRFIPTDISSFYIPVPHMDIPAAPAKMGKMFSIGAGEYRFSGKHRVGFEGVTVNSLYIDLNRVHKNAMGLAGLSVRVYKIEGFTAKVFFAPGVNMRQSIVRTPGRDNATFDGLAPVFSFGFGMEYKLHRHIQMFCKLRWLGSNVANLGAEDDRYGSVIFHTGISYKIGVPKGPKF